MLKQNLGPDHIEVARSLVRLILAISRGGNGSEVTPVMDEAERPPQIRHVMGAFLVGTEQSARPGQGRDAVAILGLAPRLIPDYHAGWHRLAPLLVAVGELDLYRVLCHATLEGFGDTEDATLAERTAKACLLHPPGSAAELQLACALADRAVERGGQHGYRHYFAFAKGLAEYRQGHFTNAVDWMRKVIGQTAIPGQAGTDWTREVWAHAVLAMAQHELEQPDEARSTLAKAVEMFQTKLPKLESGDLGETWPEWLIARILLREAKALIEGGVSTKKTSN